MFERLRIPLTVVNGVQLGLVAGLACAGAWLALPEGRPALEAAETARTAARNLAGAIDQGLKAIETDARSAALLLQAHEAAPDEARRTDLLRRWLGLHPAYADAMLVGSDGTVRVAGGGTPLGQAWFRRARGAETAIATEGGTVHLSVALGGEHLVLRVGPAWFEELEARVRGGLAAPAPALALGVTGADGVLLAGVAPPRPLPETAVEATVQTGGSRDLASAGWAVTSVMAVPAGGFRRPDRNFALLVLAMMVGGAGLGYAAAARPARRLRRLARPLEPEHGATGAAPIAEIDALERARGSAGPGEDRGLREARTGLGRVRARLRTFEAMSGWTLWEVDPATRQVIWTDPGREAAFSGDRSIELNELIDGILPADRSLMRLTMEAAMAEDGPHDVILRTVRAAPEGGERRLLVRFRRGEARHEGGVRLLALSREMGEGGEPTVAVNERRRDGTLRRVTDGIVHDVNNALTVVTANLGILKRRHALGPAEARLVDAALAGAARGAGLTRRMAGLVRTDTHSFAEADLAATVAAFLPFLQSQVLGDMPVMNRLPADLPAVRCGEATIEVLLLNLGFHFRDGGFDGFAVAGSAHEAGPEIPPGLAAGPHVRLVLASGRPARARAMPHAFPGTTPAGVPPLDAVAELVEAVGGRLAIQSDGTGTQPFLAEIWLPAEPPRAASAEPTPAQGRPACVPITVRPLRILLVESDSLVRACLSEILADLGHTVVQAASGSHALEALAGEGAFDVMITDYAMPVMSGLQLAAAVVEHHPAVRVIIAGPHGHLPRTAGRFTQLDKPFHPEDLAAMLATIAAAPMARAA
ncbi:MAG: response regulator [Methylobacterium sp.]|uniref:response regulator n=1 Tax=Methylobacterium sp. TaxID=409 RepID=UPI00271F8560|nr:response regulator [Methylobacterium sp.]MDO9428952.1 response regulator [Methylobacterium sp.]